MVTLQPPPLPCSYATRSPQRADMPPERTKGDFESSDDEACVEAPDPAVGAVAACGGDRGGTAAACGVDPVLELDATALKALVSKAAKLLSVAETHSVRAVKSILADRSGAWAGAEQRGDFLWCPASVLGLNGAPFRVRIIMQAAPAEEEEEVEEGDEEAEYVPTAEEAAAADKDEAPAQKKRKFSNAQQARSLFQHADVKQMLRAALGDELATVNAAACEAVQAAERAEAETRLEAARAIPQEKKRALEVDRAEKQLASAVREPKPMPPPDAGAGKTNEMIGQVLSQLGGSLWHLAKRDISLLENGEETLEALVETAKERPAALLETAAFKAAFKAATGKELPALQLTPCTGCRTLGCTQCRGGPTPPMEVDEPEDVEKW